MRRNIQIKGKNIWIACSLVLLAIVFTFCHTKITSVVQPPTAVVGDVVPITVNLEYSCNSSGTTNVIIAVLMPKGWNGAKNLTGTYVSTKGSGNLVAVPTTTIAPNSNGLNWQTYLMNTFGTAGNLINDVEWVVLQTDQTVSFNNGDAITGAASLKLKVGADGNPTMVKLAYVVANTTNGLTSDTFTDGGYGATAEYWNESIGNCFSVTGGTGDLVDFCNPQLTTIDPPKSLDNDFVTLTYNNNVTPTTLAGKPAVYLCATATLSDGSTVTVCDQSAKTMLKQTAANSGLYQLTIWPRSYFGVTGTQTVVSLSYYITDSTGTLKVGYGNTSAPFAYKFKCS